MKNFMKSLRGEDQVSVPALCEAALNTRFREARNVEWSRRANRYEAVFHSEGVEHIALFEAGGSLLEHKVNLAAGELPGKVRETAERKGEIMNRVLRRKGDLEDYEIIIRDTRLARFLLTIDHQGELVSETAL